MPGRVEGDLPGLTRLLVGDGAAELDAPRSAAASMSSQARSKWNCLLPLSFGQPGASWSATLPMPSAIPPGPLSMAYSSSSAATSQPSSSAQNVPFTRGSGQSRVIIFRATVMSPPS